MKRFLISLAIVLALCCLFAFSSSAAEYHVTTKDQLTSALNSALSTTEADTIYIDEDISGGNYRADTSITYVLNANWTNASQTPNAWTVASDVDIAFIANGAKRTLTFSSNRFQTNSTKPSNSSITYGGQNGGYLFVDLANSSGFPMYCSKSYTINLRNVEFSGLRISKSDWTFLSASVLNIYEGTKISNCQNTDGVLIQASTLNLYGGEICNNYCKNNMGRIVIADTFNMFGGEIHDNYQYNTRGDTYSCYMIDTSKGANLYGGSIYNNYYTKNGSSGVIGSCGNTNTKGYAVQSVVGTNYEIASVTSSTITNTDGVYSLADGTETTTNDWAVRLSKFPHSVMFKNNDGSVIDAFIIRDDGTMAKAHSGATAFAVPTSFGFWAKTMGEGCINAIASADVLSTSQATYYGVNHTLGEAKIAYPNGLAKAGIIGEACTVDGCAYANVIEENIPAIITTIGYSVREDTRRGHGISGGYLINHSALTAYEQSNGIKVDFGITIINPDSASGETFFKDGDLTVTTHAMKVESTSTKYSHLKFFVTGFDESMLDLDLIMAMYLNERIDDTVIKTNFVQRDPFTSDEKFVHKKKDATLYSISCALLKSLDE